MAHLALWLGLEPRVRLLPQETGWYMDRCWQENQDRQFPWLKYRY